MGAEFILPGNTEVARLADELGLGLWQKGMSYGRREPRGGLGTTPEALADGVGAVRDALAADPGNAISARELLDWLEIESGAREAILARLEISAGGAGEVVPASAMDGLAHIDDEPAPSVAGGNQGLALGLAERLGGRVRLGDARCGSPGTMTAPRSRRRAASGWPRSAA